MTSDPEPPFAITRDTFGKTRQFGERYAGWAFTLRDPRDLYVFVHFYSLGFVGYMFLRDWQLTWIIFASIWEMFEMTCGELVRLFFPPGHRLVFWMTQETKFNAVVVDPLCVIMGIALSAFTVLVFDFPVIRPSIDGLLILQMLILMAPLAFSGIAGWTFRLLPLLHFVLLFVVLGIWAGFPIDKIVIWTGIFGFTWLSVAIPLPPPMQEALANIVISFTLLVLLFTILHATGISG